MNLEQLFQDDPNVKSFAAGETIFGEGAVGEHMYVFSTGNLEIKVQRPSCRNGYFWGYRGGDGHDR